MQSPANRIDRVSRRLLNDGYVDDEVEAFRLAVKILLIVDHVRDAEAGEKSSRR